MSLVIDPYLMIFRFDYQGRVIRMDTFSKVCTNPLLSTPSLTVT